MKVKTSKGFTLAELLIVMAIIVVLAAVAIPTFGKQLETSRETGDMEIIRNAYTEALSIATLDGADGALNGKIGDGTADDYSSGTKPTWGTVEYQGGGVYKVSPVEFSQNATSSAWKYVNPSLMGVTVDAVDTTKSAISFTFAISTTAGTLGDISLTAIAFS